MQLISIGNTCIPQFAINESFGAKGITSPLAWSATPMKFIPTILSDKCQSLSDKRYMDTTAHKSRQLPHNTKYNIKWVHENINCDEDMNSFIDKLDHQCAYLNKALLSVDKVGYILVNYRPYTTVHKIINDILEVIPDHHQLLFCSNHPTVQPGSVRVNSKLYTSSMYCSEYEESPLKVRKYGTSKMFADIICDAFGLPDPEIKS